MNMLQRVKEVLPEGFEARWAPGPSDDVIEILLTEDGLFCIAGLGTGSLSPLSTMGPVELRDWIVRVCEALRIDMETLKSGENGPMDHWDGLP